MSVSFFSSESPQLQKLRIKVLESLDEQNKALQSAQDWGDYRYKLGRLHGVAIALDILENINKTKERN